MRLIRSSKKTGSKVCNNYIQDKIISLIQEKLFVIELSVL